jgi:hypothetical protein
MFNELEKLYDVDWSEEVVMICFEVPVWYLSGETENKPVQTTDPWPGFEEITSECECNMLLYVKYHVKIIHRENERIDKQRNEDECEEMKNILN